MAKNKFYSTVYTAAVNTINSFVSIILGLIFSRLLLTRYGSEINGFISSITQFVSFFTILEGGFTTAAIVSIYKPLTERKYDEVNVILSTAKNKYYKIGLLIASLVFVIGSIYLLFLDIPLNYISSLIIVIICLLQTFFSIALESKYTILFFGANKEYIVTMLKLIARLVGWIVSIILMINHFNIVYVYATYLITSILNVILIRNSAKKSYHFINYNMNLDADKIKGTNDLMIQKIANTVFNSTDIFLISVLINFAVASVYSVYNLIYRSIVQVLKSFLSAPFNSLGQLLNSEKKNMDEIKKISGFYHTITILASTLVLVVTAVCTLPFIQLYTRGVVDINYINEGLVYLFFSTSFFQLINQSHSSIINASGLFKSQNKICIIATILNIVLSIVLARWNGIYGILIGSLVAYILIAFYNIYICNKNILHISYWKDIVFSLLHYLCGIFMIYFGIRIVPFANNYFMLIINSCIVLIVITAIYTLYTFIINRKQLSGVINFLSVKLKKRI